MISRTQRVLSRTLHHGTGWFHRIATRRLNAAYVGGWLGSQNLGDEALLPAYRMLFPDLQLTPYLEGRLPSLLWRLTPRRIGGILAGGTLIAQKATWLDTARAWQRSDSPLAVFGTGVADTAFWPGGAPLQEWMPVLSRCCGIWVRGPLSAAALRNAGIPDVKVCGDPVLAFARKEPPARPPGPPTLGLNIGVRDLRMWGDHDTVRDVAIHIAQTARNDGWIVEWFSVTPRDTPIVRSAAEASQCPAVHCVYRDPFRFIELAGRLTAFVGMKLHATLLATCAAVPSIMLEYDPKCRDYMESISHGHATHRTDSLDAAAIWRQLAPWHASRESAVARLQAAVLEMRRTLLDSAATLQSRLVSCL